MGMKTFLRWIFFAVVWRFAFLGLTVQAAEVTVAVAANFTAPMQKIAQAFEKDTGQEIKAKLKTWITTSRLKTAYEELLTLAFELAIYYRWNWWGIFDWKLKTVWRKQYKDFELK